MNPSPRPISETPSRFQSIGRYLLYAILTLVFWAGALLTNLIALSFLPWRHKPKVRRKARIWMRRLLLLAREIMDKSGVLQFDLVDTHSLSRLQATVVVANHPSLVDAIFLLGLIPDSVCIFKKSLQRNFALGPMIRLCGFIANETGPDLVREAGSALSEGCNLIIFPEGTRSVGRLNEFKPGFALIAIRCRCPVQTVHFSYDPPFLTKGASLMDLPRRRPLIHIRPGPRVQPPPDVRARDFAQDIAEIFKANTTVRPSAN